MTPEKDVDRHSSRNDRASSAAFVGSARSRTEIWNFWEIETPASIRRWNEGVGEHVRTRFHFGREATREIAEPVRATAPNEENWFLLPDRALTSKLAKDDDPTVDLMSRRHPLSSIRAPCSRSALPEANPISAGADDVPASKSRQLQ
jgi:hypothetical protein